ncbi:MAG: type II toxin-antitoxin system VapC family toxin [Bacteroidales bacterium]|nr:type II toxin-antitoxin system VapC family toxin [Bacteroidales bacterium]
MGEQYLIDSNSVIDYLSGKLPEEGMKFMNKVIDGIPNISVITKIEILGYRTTQEAQMILEGFVSDSVIFPLIEDIVNQTIIIRKDHKVKTPDAIIAATALVQDYTLITRNTRDFIQIKDLKLLNPYKVN